MKNFLASCVFSLADGRTAGINIEDAAGTYTFLFIIIKISIVSNIPICHPGSVISLAAWFNIDRR